MRIPGDLYDKRYRDRRGRGGKRSRIGWQQAWRAWLDRRLPPAREQSLSHHKIFIFPSRAGLGFCGFLFLLLLVAINFENSAVYALVFLLFGIFVVSILHTYANLLGLKITGRAAEPAFSGRYASFPVVLAATRRRHYGVQLSWQSIASERVDLDRHAERQLDMRFRTGPRGLCRPGRIKLESSYPLGLITAWTWIDLAMETVVYPFPDKTAGTVESQAAYHESGEEERAGSDDFFGLRDYVTGDSPRSVAWKQYAKSGQLASKQFVDYIDHRLWLDWDQAQGNDEQRLSQLCHWALSAEAGHNEYGLRLPGSALEPGRGKAHLDKVLTQLALYNVPAVRASAAPAKRLFDAVLWPKRRRAT